MDSKSPLYPLWLYISRRQAFASEDGMWGTWWSCRQMYVAWSGGVHMPVLAWRDGKWYCANEGPVAGIASALAESLDGEVHFVPLSDLRQFVATGEPPVPPEVKALLSVCPE